MCISSGSALAALISLIMVRSVCSVCCGGKPRSPSLPPSSTSTQRGWCCLSSAGRRANPCCEVSPLMLAFTTGVFACHCSLSSAGQAALAAIR
ncbi:Acyl-CoA thioesterase [Klebsiella pneumoniae subsp. pneumoniae Kp13]|nr:Acyl-CoA thioesterase [Klebsiella pneumoniae subsp. pneumoniae Kp13]